MPPRLIPPALGLVGLGLAALSAVVLRTSVGPPADERPGLRGVLRLAGLAVGAFALGILGAAAVAHIDAVTIPLAGNPVLADAASVSHGAALWSAHCAGCHEEPPDVTGRSDRDALAAMTSGHDGMPAFAYRLTIEQRGDILNWLRQASGGGVPVGRDGGAPDSPDG